MGKGRVCLHLLSIGFSRSRVAQFYATANWSMFGPPIYTFLGLDAGVVMFHNAAFATRAPHHATQRLPYQHGNVHCLAGAECQHPELHPESSQFFARLANVVGIVSTLMKVYGGE